jgi:hypothetical protein
MKKADPYQMYLAGLVNESAYLGEMRVTDEGLSRLIVEYSDLSDDIDRIKMELKEREAKFKEIEVQIRPVLEALEETKEKTLQVDDIIVTFKRKGYDRASIGYKELYEYLLERVNGAMRRIVEEAKAANTKTVSVPSSIGVQRLEHGILSAAGNMIYGVWRRLLALIGIENDKIDRAIQEFRAEVAQ